MKSNLLILPLILFGCGESKPTVERAKDSQFCIDLNEYLKTKDEESFKKQTKEYESCLVKSKTYDQKTKEALKEFPDLKVQPLYCTIPQRRYSYELFAEFYSRCVYFMGLK